MPISWKQIKYLIFDSPSMPGTFEDRMEALKKLVPANHPHLQLVAQRKIHTLADVWSELDFVLSQGGEGLMLRQSLSKYEGRRSNTLLKVDGVMLLSLTNESVVRDYFFIPYRLKRC